MDELRVASRWTGELKISQSLGAIFFFWNNSCPDKGGMVDEPPSPYYFLQQGIFLNSRS